MILLSGPRQCGKTTFSKMVLKEKKSGEYLNWDQPKDRKKNQAQDWSEDCELVVPLILLFPAVTIKLTIILAAGTPVTLLVTRTFNR